MKRNTHYGLIVRTISVFLLVFILSLPLASCKADGGTPGKESGTESEVAYTAYDAPDGLSRRDLARSLQSKLLPAKETGSEAETLLGGLTPVQYLPQAPQDLVGQRLFLMLTGDQYAGSTVFRYTAPQGNSGEELAIFFGSLENSDGGGYYALVLKTEYGSMGSFLDESKKGSLRGTVTAVRYIGFNDMLHSSNNISALVNSGKDSAGKDSVICYGSIEGNGSISTVDGGTRSAPAAEVFESTLARFGLS
ncbi:MAG: hypothetical protein DBX65_00510 [Oscillospiraceae bacterium]|nr:MAG: hypothetical protein DBX65_00510 [Oscillospiraceae bacterium]